MLSFLDLINTWTHKHPLLILKWIVITLLRRHADVSIKRCSVRYGLVAICMLMFSLLIALMLTLPVRA